jgi:hypothetical protein
LAARVAEPGVWLDALVKEGAPGDLVEPFLRGTLELQRSNLEQLLESCLSSEQYIWVAAEFILQMDESPPLLLERVLEKVVAFPQFVETLCLRGQVTLANLRRLLDHPTWEVALSAAVGEWLADPKGVVRDAVAESWRNAVLRSDPNEYSGMKYWLGEILKEDPGLAFDWLLAHLESAPDPILEVPEGPFATAISALNQSQKSRILGNIGGGKVAPPLIALLVDRDPQLYRQLLKSESLSRIHLEPLSGVPDQEWAELAIVALEVGYDARAIAQASFRTAGISVFWGSLSNHWRQWDEAFAQLEEDPRREIQDIARHGRQIVQASLERAQAEERREEVFGT